MVVGNGDVAPPTTTLNNLVMRGALQAVLHIVGGFGNLGLGNLGLDLWKYVIYRDISACFIIYPSKIKFAEVSLAFFRRL